MLITARVVIVSHIQLVIIGDQINTLAGTLLGLVAIAANHMGIDKIPIELVSVLLEVIMGLVPLNQARTHLTITITTSTNAVAPRNNPIKMTIVQGIAGILNVLLHARNIKDEINIEDLNGANLIAKLRLLAIITVIKAKLAVTTVTRDSLVVMIAISGLLVIRKHPIHKIQAGRAVRKGDSTIIQISRMKIRVMKQIRSYSKATTSILTAATLSNLIHINRKWIHMLRIDQRNAKSHACPMEGF
jgi:hypothetical protein